MSALAKPKLAENEKVYVTAVESPGSFYCQISRSKEKLGSLMSEISAFYDSIPANELAVTNISVGDVCCVNSCKDNKWYRARLEENTTSELTVRFLDYGNTETLPIDRAKVLMDAFFREPPWAIKCSLHDVQPLTGESWPHEAAAFVEELTGDKELDAKLVTFTDPFHIKLSDNGTVIGEELVKAQLAVVKTTSPGDPAGGKIDYVKPVVECGEMYDVCITHTSSPGRFYCQLLNMSDQLEGMMNDLNDHYFQLSETEDLFSPTIEQPCVVQYKGIWYRAKVLNLSVNGMTVHFVDYGNNATNIEPSAVKQMTLPFLKIPQVAVECSLDLNQDEWSEETTALFEKLTGENQLVIKIVSQQGDRCEVKVFDKDAHCISGQVINTIAGAEPQQVSLSDEPLADSETITAAMLLDTTEVLKINEFIQPTITQEMTERVYVSHVVSPEDFYVQFESALDDLSLLSEEISKYCAQLQPSEQALNNPCAGMSCCARFSKDGYWYRARIKYLVSSNRAKVEFVDYGNEEVLPLNVLKEPDKTFMQLPRQAILCCLDVTKDFWSSQQRHIFREAALDKHFEAKFMVRDGEKWRVCLESNGMSIADILGS